MDDSKEIQETTQPENTESPVSKEIGDFNFLICTVIEYYGAKSAGLDEGDEWKQGTDYAPKAPIEFPKNVDALVERAFLKQLKKFV